MNSKEPEPPQLVQVHSLSGSITTRSGDRLPAAFLDMARQG
jgi:hypothetical protein